MVSASTAIWAASNGVVYVPVTLARNSALCQHSGLGVIRSGLATVSRLCRSHFNGAAHDPAAAMTPVAQTFTPGLLSSAGEGKT